VSFRARLVTYFVVVHLALAGLGGWLVWTQPYALIGVEITLIASLAVGIGLVRRAIGYRALAADARRLVHDQAFTSRFLPVGEPDVDELIALYNRMVDRLRDERVRLAEQHHFLAQVLDVSPSGIVVLGFDGEVTTLNPAAARLIGVPRTATGRPLADLGSTLAAAMAGAAAGESQVVGLDGSARVRVQRGGFVDRGFPRAFFVLEEMTGELRQAERAAYEKLIRVMSH
jgi:two-component system, NtrC family, nitrogen regulation sensor histidine kinase NtrY